MTQRQSRPCYDKAEIVAALHDLSEEEIKRMQRFARFRITGNGVSLGCADVEDLFQEAVLRTMEQRRSWPRDVSIFDHFFGVMKSIGHQFRKEAGRCSPLNETVAASQHCSLSALDAQAAVAWLEEELSGNAIPLEVLESMLDEMPARDTQRCLGVSADIYWAARKKIRRSAEKLPRALQLPTATAQKSSNGTRLQVTR